jgi:D-lactate dehydrogenase
VIDAIAFVAETMLDALKPTNRVSSLVLHPTCSSTRLGTDGPMSRIAAAIADEVVIPTDWGCCAFAGDRGMLHPELTASATSRESVEVRDRSFAAYASTNRTCEMGMARATGSPYRHLLELLEEATRPA